MTLQSELSSVCSFFKGDSFSGAGGTKGVLVTLVWLLQYCKDQAGLQIGSQYSATREKKNTAGPGPKLKIKLAVFWLTRTRGQ